MPKPLAQSIFFRDIGFCFGKSLKDSFSIPKTAKIRQKAGLLTVGNAKPSRRCALTCNAGRHAVYAAAIVSRFRQGRIVVSTSACAPTPGAVSS